jgi:DNA-directed RNA polymerase subunit RPC12/RpoP
MTEGKFKCLKCGYDLDCDIVLSQFEIEPNKTITCSQCNTEYEIHFKKGIPFLKPRRRILQIFRYLKFWLADKK